jgi:hypothetical protein
LSPLGLALRSWSPPNKESDFPEIADPDPEWAKLHKFNFGIAISGGGMRAATQALGWLRAFNELDALKKARYVSVNSGASWVTIIALFTAAARMHSEKDYDFKKCIQGPLQDTGPRDLGTKVQFLLRV